jgi:hypothetical protein
VLIDSYSEANQDDYTYVDSAEGQGVAQTFTGDGSALSSAKFYLQKFGSPTGNFTAKLYAVTGTYGTNSKPTGPALATSDAVDVSAIQAGSFALWEFTFSGVNGVTLANGTRYAVSAEFSGGDAVNKVGVGRDGSSPSHAGDGSSLSGGSWTSQAYDVIFYVYGTPAPSSLAFPPAAASAAVARSVRMAGY